MSNLVKMFDTLKEIEVGDVMYRVEGRQIQSLRVDKITAKLFHCTDIAKSYCKYTRQVSRETQSWQPIYQDKKNAVKHILTSVLNDVSMSVEEFYL
jgi:hypothetical protein